MTKQQRLDAFVHLGLFLKNHSNGTKSDKQLKFHDDLDKVIAAAFTFNGWFTESNVKTALIGIEKMLDKQDLTKFADSIQENPHQKTVAVIMAGNIPAVGFHDLLCVLLSGHKVLIKVSSDDPAIIPFLAGMLIYFETQFAPCIEFSEARMKDFDAVIATGSNNTSKHFEYYFGKYPNIIRKSRTSVGIINGKETREQLSLLGNDIFLYYGLGCRNISKVFVPKGYKFDTLFEALYDYKYVLDNKKYANNYEYNRAIYLMDSLVFLDNNFLMIKEDAGLHSSVSVLFFEYYDSLNEVDEKLKSIASEIQCIATLDGDQGKGYLQFGQTQFPTVFDFADNVNTLDFLAKI